MDVKMGVVGKIYQITFHHVKQSTIILEDEGVYDLINNELWML